MGVQDIEAAIAFTYIIGSYIFIFIYVYRWGKLKGLVDAVWRYLLFAFSPLTAWILLLIWALRWANKLLGG